MTRRLIKQSEQVRNSSSYEDQISGANTGSTAEPTVSGSLENDMNVIRTLLRQIKGTDNWYDIISENLSTISGSYAPIDHTHTSTSGLVLPDNYITGLWLSNNSTDSSYDIDIKNGKCTDITNTYSLSLGSSGTYLTKRIDANWSAGNGNGGFPSGLTLSATTWYHVFLIAKTDGTVDAGFDTSLTASNLLSDATGYTLYRRLGSVWVNSGVTIEPFLQYNGHFYRDWSAGYFDINATPSTDTKTTSTLSSVPPGVRVYATMSFSLYSGAATATNAWFQLYVKPTDLTDVSPGLGSPVRAFGVNYVAAVSESRGVQAETTMDVLTNTSAQIDWRMDASGASTWLIRGAALHYYDFRGQL